MRIRPKDLIPALVFLLAAGVIWSSILFDGRLQIADLLASFFELPILVLVSLVSMLLMGVSGSGGALIAVGFALVPVVAPVFWAGLARLLLARSGDRERTR